MALAGSIVGTGIVTGYSKATRNLRDAGESYYNLVETVENEQREWVALTQSAAATAAAAGTGEASMSISGTGTTYENSYDEDNRVIGSYVYRCSAEKKTIAFA